MKEKEVLITYKEPKGNNGNDIVSTDLKSSYGNRKKKALKCINLRQYFIFKSLSEY